MLSWGPSSLISSPQPTQFVNRIQIFAAVKTVLLVPVSEIFKCHRNTNRKCQKFSKLDLSIQMNLSSLLSPQNLIFCSYRKKDKAMKKARVEALYKEITIALEDNSRRKIQNLTTILRRTRREEFSEAFDQGVKGLLDCYFNGTVQLANGPGKSPLLSALLHEILWKVSGIDIPPPATWFWGQTPLIFYNPDSETHWPTRVDPPTFSVTYLAGRQSANEKRFIDFSIF